MHPRHRETSGAASDRSRDRAAASVGWTTTRISKAQYDTHFNETMAEIASQHADLRHRTAA